jgi:hypothetical protein
LAICKVVLECPFCNEIFEAESPDKLHSAYSIEKPVGTAKRCFRVKVVGSNPAGPTKKPGFSPTVLVAKIEFSWIRRNWHK